MPARPLLVLDVDETLWHGLETPIGVSFLLRPHLREFLEQVGERYDLAVWSSATADWLEAGFDVVRQEAGFDLPASCFFVWDRSRCALKRTEDGEYERRKPARKLRAGWIRAKYPRERILAVDDTPAKWACGYGHLVRVREWTGDQRDDELLLLAAYLLGLAEQPNFRSLEKRGWRSLSGKSVSG